MRVEMAPSATNQASAHLGGSGVGWPTKLFALLAGLSGLLAHALAPALVVALWQNALLAHPSTASVLDTRAAWALFIGSYLVAALLITLCAAFAAHAAAMRTARRASGVSAAALVATGGAIALASGGLLAVLVQASPLTAVNSPPLGVAPLAFHEGMAQGLALFYCAAYLPLLLLACLCGLPGAARGARMALRLRAAAPTIALVRAPAA
jgi:hypothetical protein